LAWLVKFRKLAGRLARRWLRRRSQASAMSLPDFAVYLTRHPLVDPQKLLDLIAPPVAVVR